MIACPQDTESAAKRSFEGRPPDLFDTSPGYPCPGSGCPKGIHEPIIYMNLLYFRQHRFRQGLSTVTQLLEIIYDFAAIIDSRLQADAMFIDFSKAFDRLLHSLLIFKLKSIGINP